jgi:hypothetical protein
MPRCNVAHGQVQALEWAEEASFRKISNHSLYLMQLLQAPAIFWETSATT